MVRRQPPAIRPDATLVLSSLFAIREDLLRRDIVGTAGQHLTSDDLSIRVWRLPRWYFWLRCRRRNGVLAIVDSLNTLVSRSTMVRVADIRSKRIGEGTRIRWVLQKGIQGSVTFLKADPPREAMIHRKDLLDGDGGPRPPSINESTRIRLGLTKADVTKLVATYGSAVAVPLFPSNKPFPVGCICVDTPADLAFSANSLPVVEEILAAAAEPLANLLVQSCRRVRNEVRWQ